MGHGTTHTHTTKSKKLVKIYPHTHPKTPSHKPLNFPHAHPTRHRHPHTGDGDHMTATSEFLLEQPANWGFEDGSFAPPFE
jgi:hypothetical protein